MSNWSFLTNHGHVLLAIARGPELPMREIAQQVGITERAVQRIVADLVETGCVVRIRSGRQNTYQICVDQRLKHPLLAHLPLASLVALVTAPPHRDQVASAAEKAPDVT
jgi:DNA-binding IclR family transcriptional regulator